MAFKRARNTRKKDNGKGAVTFFFDLLLLHESYAEDHVEKEGIHTHNAVFGTSHRN